MAWTPDAPAAILTPDQILALLTRSGTDPINGYITPQDMTDAFDALMSRDYWKAPIICTSSTRPAGVDGMMIYETDTKRLRLHDGTGWIIQREPLQSYTPGTPDIANATAQGVFQRSNGWCDFKSNVTLPAGFGFLTNPAVNLPVPAGTAAGVGLVGAALACNYYNTNFGIVQGVLFKNSTTLINFHYLTNVNGSSAPITTTTPVGAWGTNSQLMAQGRYQIDMYA